MDNAPEEIERHRRLIDDAFSRGQNALAAGDAVGAVEWLDRARRLAPGNPVMALSLAAALIPIDAARAAAVFQRVLSEADLREAWFGLAAARFRMGDMAAARAALASGLCRHAPPPSLTILADRIAEATGAPGWCGLAGSGVLTARTSNGAPVRIRLDGRTIETLTLPDGWRDASEVSLTAGRRALIGSPISVQAIGRVEGAFEPTEDGVRGWAWHPGDPDLDPVLTLTAGRTTMTKAASDPAGPVPGLSPAARTRAFFFPLAETHRAAIRVRGPDGRDLPPVPPATEGRQYADPRQWRTVPWTDTTILITHDEGGGVAHQVETEAARLRRRGHRVIVIRPAPGGEIRLQTGGRDDLPDLSYVLPRDQAAVLDLLRHTRPTAVQVHHLLNHDPSIMAIVRSLGVPYEFHAHDYFAFCPRIALVGPDDRHCGEPDVPACEACVAESGGHGPNGTSVADHIVRSREILSGARRLIAPSRDTAARMERHFPEQRFQAVPHEKDTAVPEPPPIRRPAGRARICVAGAVGLHKGYFVLLDLARDARDRGLDLEFRVVGTTIDDQRLLDTGRVFITGPYERDEAVDLIRAQNATMALMPSIWPETWSLALTELWRAGLRVAAFDLGAPAERIRATGRGVLLPPGLAAGQINNALLNAVSGRSLLPVRASRAYKSQNAATQSK